MNEQIERLRVLRNVLHPVLSLADDMSALTGRDETLYVLCAANVAPTIALGDFALGNKLDKARFRRVA